MGARIARCRRPLVAVLARRLFAAKSGELSRSNRAGYSVTSAALLAGTFSCSEPGPPDTRGSGVPGLSVPCWTAAAAER